MDIAPTVGGILVHAAESDLAISEDVKAIDVFTGVTWNGEAAIDIALVVEEGNDEAFDASSFAVIEEGFLFFEGSVLGANHAECDVTSDAGASNGIGQVSEIGEGTV